MLASAPVGALWFITKWHRQPSSLFFLLLCSTLYSNHIAQAGGTACGPDLVVHELQILHTSQRAAGRVLAARRLRAAHCLTSLQVSPAGQLLLVAYGRRHISLVRTLLEGSSIIPVHTVLEVRLPTWQQLIIKA